MTLNAILIICFVMNAIEFERNLINEKQQLKLAAWQRWARGMQMLRQIHTEIADKKAALIRVETITEKIAAMEI